MTINLCLLDVICTHFATFHSLQAKETSKEERHRLIQENAADQKRAHYGSEPNEVCNREGMLEGGAVKSGQ